MKRYGLEILPILAAALVLSGCGGAGEKDNSNNAGTTAPANVNAATPVGTSSVTPANNSALAPTPLATPLPAGGNTPQPGTSPGSGTRSNTNSAPPTQMPTTKIGSGGNDFFLFTKARAAINADAELSAANVILDIKEGAATLSGTVANAEQKSKAERLVREVGLKTVRNQLRVSAGK